MPAKKILNTIFSPYYFLKVHSHHFSKIKSHLFCMMIKGSGSEAGSGSIPLTSGSGSGRPKNMWIRWIRNTANKVIRFLPYSGGGKPEDETDNQLTE
jgi:hypothetical protein